MLSDSQISIHCPLMQPWAVYRVKRHGSSPVITWQGCAGYANTQSWLNKYRCFKGWIALMFWLLAVRQTIYHKSSLIISIHFCISVWYGKEVQDEKPASWLKSPIRAVQFLYPWSMTENITLSYPEEIFTVFISRLKPETQTYGWHLFPSSWLWNTDEV